MKEFHITYKWRKIFASKRFNSTNGNIELSVLEQDEILNDIQKLINNK